MLWKLLSKLGLILENGHINRQGKCWICTAESSLEDHHIVPRCSGGENGPQVELCAICHAGVHKAAISSKAIKEFNIDLCYTLVDFNEAWITQNQHAKAFALAGTIRLAAEHVKGDENKTAKYATTWTGEDKRIINDLKRVTGVKSQDKVVRLALRSLHKQYFK